MLAYAAFRGKNAAGNSLAPDAESSQYCEGEFVDLSIGETLIYISAHYLVRKRGILSNGDGEARRRYRSI